MRKFRILLDAFTLRRDIMVNYVFAELLKNRGFDVKIACCRNYSTYLKHWNPDALVVSVPGRLPTIMQHTPKAKVYFYPGEGGEPTNYLYENSYFNTRMEEYEFIEHYFMWGDYNKREADKVLPEYKNKRSVAGNLRLDIPKYNPIIDGNRKNLNSIGIIGRFEGINNYTGRPPIVLLAEPEERFLPDIINQCLQFHAIFKVVRHLIEKTDLNISIRPHPLEAPEGYDRLLNIFPRERFHIDKSFDYTGWLYKQKMIFSPASTTFIEAYLLKVPVVNVDKALGIEKSISVLNPFTSMSHKCSYQPESMEELIDLLTSSPDPMTNVPEIDEHLKDIHHWDPHVSVLAKAADDIAESMARKCKRKIVKKPAAIAETFDWYHFSKSTLSLRLHLNFNYKKGFHKIPRYYDKLVDNIENDNIWEFIADENLKKEYGNRNFIIGGPSRNGKTTLVNTVYKNKNTVVGLPVEALLDVFNMRFYPFKNIAKKQIAKDYLNLQRYTNQQRTEKSKPLDFFKSDISSICKKLSFKPNNQLSVIFKLLKIFAEENGALNWAVCDLHPERLYDVYKSYCHNLNLIVILRDPREAVCASLHWRDSNKNENSEHLIKYALLLWLFSAKTYLVFKEKHPDSVHLFCFNDLLDENSENSQRMANILNIPETSFKENFPEGHHFKFKDGLFMTPEGKWKELLSKEEINFIEKYTGHVIEQCGLDFNFKATEGNSTPLDDETFKTIYEKMIAICITNPNSAKNFIDTSIYCPAPFQKSLCTRWMNEFKRLARLIIKH